MSHELTINQLLDEDGDLDVGMIVEGVSGPGVDGNVVTIYINYNEYAVAMNEGYDNAIWEEIQEGIGNVV